MTWMGGGMLKADLKINFLDFIAIPITIGIGVDYGVNIVQRYRAEGRVNIARVIRGTGAAVALASFTTVIGYSSLLIAGNQGFVSFGRLAVLGEITCLLAALWGLPAYLKLREGKAIGPNVTARRLLPGLLVSLIRSAGDTLHALLEVLGKWKTRTLRIGTGLFTLELTVDPERAGRYS